MASKVAVERIVLVRDEAEWAVFRAAQSSDWQQYRVYTYRPAACLELRAAGIPAHTLSEHIPAAEAAGIYRRAFAEATQVVEAASAAQGASLVQLARLFKVYYWEFLVDTYALDTVLSQWDRERGGVSVYYVRRLSPTVATHADLVDPGPLAEHMFRVLKGKGQLHSIQAPSRFWSDIRRLVRAWLRRRGRSALGRLRRTAKWRRVNRPQLPVGRRAIGWGNSYDALIVMPDMVQLAEETGLRPLLVADGIDGGTNRTGLISREAHESIERFPIGRYLSGRPAPSLTSQEKAEVDLAFAGVLRAIDATEVGAKYRLSSFMRGLRREFASSLLLAKQMDHILSQWAGSTLALTNFNGAHERIIEQLAPSHKIQVHARQHGWIANPEGYEFEAAQYVVPGRLQVQFVRQFFGYGEQVVEKPDLNLIRVADEWLSRSLEDQQTIATEKRHSLGINAKYVIVILATMARPRMLNEFEYSTFHTCWLRILDYLKSHPELHLVVKGHPNPKVNYNPWLSALARAQGVKNISVLSEPLEGVLGWADLVVDLGYPGTAIIATLLFRKPLLLYRRLFKYVRAFGDITHAESKSFTVETPDALLQEWDRFIREGDPYLRALQARNRVLMEGLTGRKETGERDTTIQEHVSKVGGL